MSSPRTDIIYKINHRSPVSLIISIGRNSYNIKYSIVIEIRYYWSRCITIIPKKILII